MGQRHLRTGGRRDDAILRNVGPLFFAMTAFGT
jgi:hypothetical protein